MPFLTAKSGGTTLEERCIMRRRAFAGLTFGIAGITLLGATPSPDPEPTWRLVPAPRPPSHEGCVNPGYLPLDQPMRLAAMPELDGSDFALEKLRHYGVWLNFFATWCGPCHGEMPNIVRLAAERFEDGLRVIAVNVGEHDDTVRPFRKQYGITFPIAMDRSGGLFDSLKLKYYPSSIFIKPDGHLSCIRRGALARREMEDEVNDIAASRP